LFTNTFYDLTQGGGGQHLMQIYTINPIIRLPLLYDDHGSIIGIGILVGRLRGLFGVIFREVPDYTVQHTDLWHLTLFYET
jgi:hypothetical protein